MTSTVRPLAAAGTPGSLAVPVVVGVAVVGAVVAAALASVDSAATFWLGALWATWLGGLVWAITRRPVSLAFVTLWGWLLVYVVIGATAATIEGQAEIGVWVFRAGVTPAVAMVTLSSGALWAGAALVHLVGRGRPHGRWRVGTAGAARPAPLPSLTAERLDRWALMLVVLAASSLVLYVRLAGAGLSSLNVLAGSAVYGDVAGSAGASGGTVVQYLKTLNALAGVALVLLAYRLVVVSRRRWGRAVVVVAAATVLLILSGGRSWLFVPTLAAGLFVWRPATGRWTARTRRWLVLGGVSAFAFAAVVGGVRGQAGEPAIDPAAFARKEVIGVFPPTAGLVETVPRQHDHLEGSSYLELVALPVPRALWPDKPQTVLGDVQLAIFGKNIGASFGFHGELFANFGWAGVLVGSLLFGGLLEATWRSLVRTRTLPAALLLSVALAVLVQVFSRGYVAGQLAGQFGLVMGALAVALLIRRSSPAAAREAM